MRKLRLGHVRALVPGPTLEVGGLQSPVWKAKESSSTAHTDWSFSKSKIIVIHVAPPQDAKEWF